MPRRSLVLGVLCCLVATGFFPAGPPPIHAADLLPGYVALPLEDTLTHLAVIRATINGQPTSLIVDTGASATTLGRVRNWQSAVFG